MNEEEKKATAFLRFYVSDDEDEYFSRDYCIDKNLIETILHLIDKQQKEIKELKHDNSILCEMAYTGKRIQMPYTMEYTGTDNYISKDKIKEKMRGEINKSWRNTEQRKCQLYAYDILKELLGE